MRLCKASVVFFVVAIAAVPCGARTWHVGPNGEFREIADALVVAVPGDVIIAESVRYEPFVLDKGVMIRSAGGGILAEHVAIRNIPAGERAGIAGMTSQDAIEITDNAGDVVLEKIHIQPGFTCERDPYPSSWVTIERSTNVAIHGLTHDPCIPCFIFCDDRTGIHGMSVVDSRVRLAEVVLEGGISNDRPFGGHGIDTLRSLVVLAGDVHLRGGDGTDVDISLGGNGDHGGDGIYAVQSDVIVLGRGTDKLEGGDGGDGGFDQWGCDVFGCVGGNGGNGLTLRSDSATVSRVTLRGGSPGTGRDGSGNPGEEYTGPVTFDDRYPLFEMTRLRIGRSSHFVITREIEPGAVILFLAERTGFIFDPNFVGPPFAVAPGGFFFSIFFGSTDRDGILDVQATIPFDPALAGFVLNAQAMINADSGVMLLSNGISRVIAE